MNNSAPTPNPICRLTIHLESQKEVEILREIVQFYVDNGIEFTVTMEIAIKLRDYIDENSRELPGKESMGEMLPTQSGAKDTLSG